MTAAVPTRLLWCAAWSLLAFFVVGSLTASGIVADGLMNLYLGRHVLEHGIPHVDTLTVAGEGRPWIDQQWLAHVMYYGAFRAGEYAAVATFSAAATGVAFGLLAWLMTAGGRSALSAAPWMLGALLATFMNTFVRAQSLVLPLFVLVLALVLVDARQERFRWQPWAGIFLAFVAWANMHGSILLVAFAVSAYAAGRCVVHLRRRSGASAVAYAATALAAPATLFAGPYGVDVAGYYGSVIGNGPIASTVSEWQPAQVGSFASTPYLLLACAVIAAVAYQWARGRRPPVALGAAALGFGLLGATALRYHVWGAIPLALLGCVMTARAKGGGLGDVYGARERRLLATAVAGLLAAVVALEVAYLQRDADDWLIAAPLEEVQAAARLMQDEPELRILADPPSAPALLWIHPEATAGRVGFDARLEHFDERDLQRYFHFALADHPRWLDAADGYDLLLVTRSQHARAARLLERSPEWDVVTRSGEGVLVRRVGAPRPAA